MPKTQKAVRLMKRVKLHDQWRWCRLALDPKRQPRRDIVLVKGREQRHPEGAYALFWKENGRNRSEPAGKDFAQAITAFRRRQTRLNAALAGVAIPEPQFTDAVLPLELAVEDFLSEMKGLRKPKTVAAYRNMLRYFLESCTKLHVHEIERRDLLNFVGFLRNQRVGDRPLGDRTIYNRFELLMTFLKANKITGLVSAKDWPRYTEKEVEVYEPEEVTAFFAHCNPEQRVVFRFFLGSGAREQEVAFTAWTDLDLRNGLWHVRAKPDRGFKPKDYEERTVPLPDVLVNELKQWHNKNSKNYLAFPNDSNDPQGHLLRDLKQVALEAGLTCGHCTTRKGLSCKRHPVCRRWYLHKFRATAATNWLQNGVDIRTVQTWLGHSDMESTLRYLKAAAARKPIVKEKVNAAFAGLTGCGISLSHPA
jgi:integrase